MLTEKEKRILANHEEKLAMPVRKFILIFGVLAWGIPVALMYSAMTLAVTDKTLPDLLQKELWINLILFPLGGILYGWVIRKLMTRQYQKLKAKESAV